MECMAKLKNRGDQDGCAIWGDLQPRGCATRGASVAIRADPVQGMQRRVESVLQDRFGCQDLGLPVLLSEKPLPTKLQWDECHQHAAGTLSQQRRGRVRGVVTRRRRRRLHESIRENGSSRRRRIWNWNVWEDNTSRVSVCGGYMCDGGRSGGLEECNQAAVGNNARDCTSGTCFLWHHGAGELHLVNGGEGIGRFRAV
jgi:hypothetical protein